MAINRPQLAEFDHGAVTPFKMLRSMSPELRGVVTNLHEALKEMRSCVFRAGALVLTEDQVARLAWLEPDALARTLPVIMQAGFMAVDNAGALYSPHLYAKLLRKEEREARKSLSDQYWQQAEEAGTIPDGLTRQQIANKKNAQMAGRPRKGESREQAFARRQREQAQKQKQSHLLMPIPGSKNDMENRNRKSKQENSINSISLEEERYNNNLNNTLSSSSNSREFENPKPDAAEVSHIAQKAREAGGIGADQRTYAENFVRKWLRAGANEQLIVQNIAPLHGVAQKFGYFDIPVMQAIQQKSTEPSATPDIPKDDAERQAKAAWDCARPVWKSMIDAGMGIGVVAREWPPVARDKGFPDCPPGYDAYVAYFRKQAKGERAAA